MKHTQVHVRRGDAHQACRLLLAGQGAKGQEAVGGALLKLLGGCPCAVLGLPQLMAAGLEGSAAGLLSLLRAKAGRWRIFLKLETCTLQTPVSGWVTITVRCLQLVTAESEVSCVMLLFVLDIGAEGEACSDGLLSLQSAYGGGCADTSWPWP